MNQTPLRFDLDPMAEGLAVTATVSTPDAEFVTKPVVLPWPVVVLGVLGGIAYSEARADERKRLKANARRRARRLRQ
jgi:hypothetical protein